MFWVDHLPPHFHAMFGEYEALIAIENTAIIAGSLPLGARSLVSQWVELHRQEPSRPMGIGATRPAFR